ncbi:MAG: [citrate (pro-3S)-lyase] ligase [Clostridiaceae bacterium]
MDIVTERVNLENQAAVSEVVDFLKSYFGMKYDLADVTLVIRRDDEIIATGSLLGNVIKYLGVLPEYRGENLTEAIVTELINEAFLRGIFHYFIFTDPDNIGIMESLGFKEVMTTKYSSLLELGNTDIESYLKDLSLNIGSVSGVRGSIVMNLNPMTLGHLYLIESALKEVDELIIFVVEEDSSVYPFEARIGIVKKEMEKYSHVKVIPGGPYIISKATFPTYFLKRLDDDIKAYTYMDASIFGKYFAKELGITKRFVGEEPLDELTEEYNVALKEVLKKYGVELKIIERKEKKGGPISASRVRKFLSIGDEAGALELVPEATKDYLLSAEGRSITDKLQKGN